MSVATDSIHHPLLALVPVRRRENLVDGCVERLFFTQTLHDADNATGLAWVFAVTEVCSRGTEQIEPPFSQYRDMHTCPCFTRVRMPQKEDGWIVGVILVVMSRLSRTMKDCAPPFF